jgi:hypothetical protein
MARITLEKQNNQEVLYEKGMNENKKYNQGLIF